MTSEGQDTSLHQQQQQPSRPASPPKERSQTPKLFTPVGLPAAPGTGPGTPDISEIPPSKRRSLSPVPPSAHSDSFPNPFNAPFHSHSMPASLGSHSAPPEVSTPTMDLNRQQLQPQQQPQQQQQSHSQQTPRPYNSRPGFKIQTSGFKLGPDSRQSPEDASLLEAILAKDEERKRNQSISKPRKGSRAGDVHRRTSSGGLTTIPYIPKGFRNIISNEPAQTPLMQAIHNPISLDTGPSTSGYGSSSIPRMHSPHHGGPPKLGLNTQLSSRTGSPEPGSSATPTTAASPGSPMGRRKSRAQGEGEKPPGSSKPRARQRSLLPKSATIQFESVPYPYPNSESSVFVQVSPRTSTTSLQFQPPLVPYQPPPPPQRHQHQLPPPGSHSGSPLPPGGPAGGPHPMFMSPIGPPPPPPHFGPPPPGYPHFGMHQGIPPPRSPSASHQSLPPPPRPPQSGVGNPFSSNGAHPPEFRPIDYGHPRGPPPPHLSRHEFSPIMSNLGGHPDGLRKALFPQHERPVERKSSLSRTTPFSGPPSTFMDEVTSPTTGHFHGSSTFHSYERRDQPIVAPKSPSPQPGQHASGEHSSKPTFSLGPPLHFITHSSSPHPFFHQHPPSSSHHPPLSLATLSPTKESNYSHQPTTPTMARRKASDKPKSSSKASASAGGQRVSVSAKSQQPPPPSPKTPKGESSGASKDNPISPAAPMIKRRSAYVAGGGIKTTDLALPKPEVVEIQAPPPEQPSTPHVDPEFLLAFNKPRKRNRGNNPSVFRMREKEVDDAMPEVGDDPDDQLVREMHEAENRHSVETEDGREPRTRQRSNGVSRESEEPPKPRRRRRTIKSKPEISDDEDEDDDMEDVPPPPPAVPKRSRRVKQEAPPSLASQETATEEEELPVLGKRTRKATTRAIKSAEQLNKRRRTRKAGTDDPDVQTDNFSGTSGAESVAPEPPAPAPAAVKKPARRGRRPAVPKDAKEEKKVAPAEETASEVEFADEAPTPPTKLIVDGKPIRLPTPPPGVKKPGLVTWYRLRERPKFTEASDLVDTSHTIRRLKDRERLHHLKTSVSFFEQPSLIDADGWTDTEQELEKMGKSRSQDAKLQKTALWDSQISDAAFEKGFEQLERKGSVEPLSAVETPRGEFPPDIAPVRQLTALSHMEKLDAGTPNDDAATSTAVATPMAEIDGDSFPLTADKERATPFVPPTHTTGFQGQMGDRTPAVTFSKHTERKRKVNRTDFDTESARNLKGIKWIVPHFEGRSNDILKQTLEQRALQRQEKEKAEAEAQAVLAEDAKADKLKPKRGGRRGKKKTKGDLKNLAYAREVRRAKLEGAKIQTPDDDNLSVVSGSFGGDGGEASDATIEDDLSENSDHDSDWSVDDDELEPTPEMVEIEKKYEAVMADPKAKAFFEEWVPKLFPNIYELPEDATRNRGPEYTDAVVFGKAIDTALDIDDQNILQEVIIHTTMHYAMVTDEKTRLDNYQVKRGFIKPESLLRRATKRKADDAGLDEGEDGPGPRYSTRRRTVKNPDADDQLGMTGYATPRLGASGSFHDGRAETPEREVRVYKPRGGRGGRGGRGRGGAGALAKAENPKPNGNSGESAPANGNAAPPVLLGPRGGKLRVPRGGGRGGRGRGRGQVA
ncbi:hypothetical protein TWF694_006719 [Orbilia ellipsospora]|uniref:Uncharacterized protein n=1 Tax=Orbilia ellipsospora TaxID=2528407 RepID=A0AAV9XKY9_9PEZI